MSTLLYTETHVHERKQCYIDMSYHISTKYPDQSAYLSALHELRDPTTVEICSSTSQSATHSILGWIIILVMLISHLNFQDPKQAAEYGLYDGCRSTFQLFFAVVSYVRYAVIARVVVF